MRAPDQLRDLNLPVSLCIAGTSFNLFPPISGTALVNVYILCRTTWGKKKEKKRNRLCVIEVLVNNHWPNPL